MAKKSELAAFLNVYDSQPPVALRGWPMKKSTLEQEPISLYFEIPKDFEYKGDAEVDLHLLVANTSEYPVTNKKINVRVRADYKGDTQDLGSCFMESKEKHVTIEEPHLALNCKRLKHYRVTVPLDTSKIDAQDLALFIFDRHSLNPEFGNASEYDADIYLAGVTFRYKRKVRDE